MRDLHPTAGLVRSAQIRPLDAAARSGRRLSAATRADLERRSQRRALTYLLAFYSGLRAGERRALAVHNLLLDATPPHVFLPGEHTKNGEDAILPLPDHLANQLRAWVADRHPDDPVFDLPKYNDLLDSFKLDLAHAGIPDKDGLGRSADLHSL